MNLIRNIILIGHLLLLNLIFIKSGELINYKTSPKAELIAEGKPWILEAFHHKNVLVKINIGDCKECGRALEKALIKLNGIQSVELIRKSKTLKIVYDPASLTEQEIHKKIAEKGYDNELFKADDNAYSNLPECCRYRKL